MKRIFSRIMPLVVALTLSLPLMAEEAVREYPILGNIEFAEIIKDKNTQLVDVRTPAEFNAGYIPGAINLNIRNVEQFESGVAKLDKKKTVAVYCKKGSRSAMAAKKLTEMGYKVVELPTGFDNWDGPVAKNE